MRAFVPERQLETGVEIHDGVRDIKVHPVSQHTPHAWVMTAEEVNIKPKLSLKGEKEISFDKNSADGLGSGGEEGKAGSDPRMSLTCLSRRQSLNVVEQPEVKYVHIHLLCCLTGLVFGMLAVVCARMSLDPQDGRKWWFVLGRVPPSSLIPIIYAMPWIMGGYDHVWLRQPRKFFRIISCAPIFYAAAITLYIWVNPPLPEESLSWKDCASDFAKVYRLVFWSLPLFLCVYVVPNLITKNSGRDVRCVWPRMNKDSTLAAWYAWLVVPAMAASQAVQGFVGSRLGSSVVFPFAFVVGLSSLVADTFRARKRTNPGPWRRSKGYSVLLGISLGGIPVALIASFLAVLSNATSQAAQIMVVLIFQVIMTILMFIVRSLARRAVDEEHVMTLVFSILLADDTFSELMFTALDVNSIAFFVAMLIQYCRMVLRDSGLFQAGIQYLKEIVVYRWTGLTPRRDPLTEYERLVQQCELMQLNFLSEMCTGLAAIGIVGVSMVMDHNDLGVDGVTLGSSQRARRILIAVYFGQMLLNILVHKIVVYWLRKEVDRRLSKVLHVVETQPESLLSAMRSKSQMDQPHSPESNAVATKHALASSDAQVMPEMPAFFSIHPEIAARVRVGSRLHLYCYVVLVLFNAMHSVRLSAVALRVSRKLNECV